ncbi:Protein ABHD1, partial [Taenia solium]
RYQTSKASSRMLGGIKTFKRALNLNSLLVNISDLGIQTSASPATKIDRIRTPLLCLNAADGPLVPFACAVNTVDSRVMLAILRQGGHIGFLAGLLPTRPTRPDRVVPQFASSVFQHPEHFFIAEDFDDNNIKSKDGDTDSIKEATTTFY